MSKRHPMQPLEYKEGVIRFKINKIVRFMLDQGAEGRAFDLNTIGTMAQAGLFDKDDLSQLAQLLGYSVSGYGDLSYARAKHVAKADRKAARMVKP